MDIFNEIVIMIWLVLPAYLANPVAALVVFFTKNAFPIDFGKNIKGNRILGEGKTFKGFVAGVAFGVIVGCAQNLFNQYILAFSMPNFNIIALFTLPFGAMTGDLIASFIKRRLNFKRGQAFPLLDQLDFLFGAMIITYLITPSWFEANFSYQLILVAFIFTPLIHLVTNIIGYKIGVSKEPW